MAGAATLVAASLAVDAMLARRLAGGSEQADRATCRLLVTSLTSNTLLGFACVLVPYGRFHVAGLAPAALALGAFGLALRWAAIARLGRLFTWRVAILDDHPLITDGVYRWIRHPSYTGGLFAAAGVLLALGNALPLAVFAATHLPLVLHRVRIEERVLAGHFGEAWQTYTTRTWRLLPGVW